MTHRQRVQTALQHRQPDRVPYCVTFTRTAHERMAACLGDPDFEARINNAMVVVSLRKASPWRQVESNVWEDDFGVWWNRAIDKDIGVVCNRVVTPDNPGHCAFPDPAHPSRYQAIERAVQSRRDRFVLVNFGFSLFERAWSMAGMEDLLVAMLAEPQFVHALMDRILEFNLAVLERACKYDIDAVLFGDDWGHQTGLIMGRRLWQEFIQPRMQRMYRFVKERGQYVMHHSCGKVDELFGDLIDMGLDVFNPFQPEVMDVFAIKKAYGRHLSFYGGISTQRTLPLGTPQQVRDEVRRLLDEVGRDGGYIAAPSHAVVADARPENILAMLEVLDGQ